MCTQGSTAFSLGVIPMPEQPEPPAAATKEKGAGWNKFMDIVDKGLDVFNAVKSSGGSSGSDGAYIPPPAQNRMSTGTKILIGVLAASVIGGTVYMVTRKKRK